MSVVEILDHGGRRRKAQESVLSLGKWTAKSFFYFFFRLLPRTNVFQLEGVVVVSDDRHLQNERSQRFKKSKLNSD